MSPTEWTYLEESKRCLLEMDGVHVGFSFPIDEKKQLVNPTCDRVEYPYRHMGFLDVVTCELGQCCRIGTNYAAAQPLSYSFLVSSMA